GATYQQPNQVNGVYDFQVGIAPIPQLDKANPKVISMGPSICAFKNDDPQKMWASWLFLKHLATDDAFQAAVSMTNGYAPVTKSVLENPDYADFLAKGDSDGTKYIQAYAVKVAISQHLAMFSTEAFYGSAVAREQVGLLMQKCLSYTGADVAAAIKSAFEVAIAECKYQIGIDDPDTPEDPTKRYFNENGELYLFKDGVPTFNFVIANNAIINHLASIEDIADTLESISGADIDVKLPGEEAQDVEILIGSVTNRGDEYIIDTTNFGNDDFAVKQIGTKIAVVAATKTALEKAINYLSKEVFGIQKYNPPIDTLVMSADKNHDVK
ncbi:MAG: extracellular solute-binding protein, partial [Clostridia bacterium]|nr:extracellular solute-binding protein [Clostridia bacterium]